MSLIDKVGWLQIQDRKVLFVRSKGKEVFYFPGGKREGTESHAQALVREIKEELNVDLIPSTIQYVTTFKTQADGKEEGVFVESKYYTADYSGTFKPMREIEELAWFSSKEVERLTPMGKLTLAWLKDKGLID